MQLEIIQSRTASDRIKITITKDELIEQVQKYHFICWSIEAAVKQKADMTVWVDSGEVIDTIRQLVPNRFRKVTLEPGGVYTTIGEALLKKYHSRRGGPLEKNQSANTRINLIKAIPSNEITFDLMYRMIPRV
jgi:hypothetical protein